MATPSQTRVRVLTETDYRAGSPAERRWLAFMVRAHIALLMGRGK